MTTLSNIFARLGKRARTGLATLVAALLVSGAAWHGMAADASAPAAKHNPQATTVAAQPSTTGRVVAGGRDSYADVVKAVGSSVVTIRTESTARVSPTQFDGDNFFRRFFGDPFDQYDERQGRGQRQPRMFRQRALGSGVIVSSDGYILTNAHVVDAADDIRVDLPDGRTVTAKVVGADKPSDLALLKLTAADLHPIALGDSDAVQVGDVVLAVGNPLGLGQTVTMGIISAKGRHTGNGDGSYEDFLQTDAPINHGNSGGALVNTKGELVGINSQILSSTGENIGIGFAIPVNMARRVMDDLRKDGRVRRSQLGVTVQPVTSEMAESLGLKKVGGAIVSSVAPDSPAERAGVKRGDVITSFNGQTISDFNSLRNHVADAAPGSNAMVGIIRDGAEKTLTVKLAEASANRRAERDSEPAADDKAALGVSVAPLTPQLADELGVPKNTHGVVVQEVNPSGRAADAGIRQGDIIQEVNRRPVQSVDELRAEVRRTTDKPLLLLVHRKDAGDLFVTVRPANG
jgi:Do/DeqQ family serine protease